MRIIPNDIIGEILGVPLIFQHNPIKSKVKFEERILSALNKKTI